MEESKYEEGKYFVCGEKEKQRWKRRKIFGERKYSFVSGGEGKGIKCLFEEEKKKREGKGEKHLEKENIFCGGEGEGGKYFEKENILFVEEKKNRAGKRGKYLEKEKKNGEGKGGKYLEKEN